MSTQEHHRFQFVRRITIAVLLCLALRNANGQENSKAAARYDPQVILGDYHYFFGLFEKVSWYRAIHICAFHGMTLASIQTQNELDALQKYLTQSNLLDEKYWLSANRLAKYSEFHWLSDGSPVILPNWESDTAELNFPPKDCVRTTEKFKWVVANCQEENYFICQEPINPLCGIRNGCQRRS